MEAELSAATRCDTIIGKSIKMQCLTCEMGLREVPAFACSLKNAVNL